MIVPDTDEPHAWSHARAHIMATCQRQFFFQYCADARPDHSDARLRDLSLLKHVRAIAMWKGDVVHQALANYFGNLKLGRALPYARVAQYAEQLAQDQWAFSQAGRYRTSDRFQAGRTFAALLEHEYQVQDAETLDEALAHIRTCLSNFFAIDRENAISSAFREGRRHLVEPPAWGEDATTFTIPGIRVTVKVDLAFTTSDGRYLIYDWKTGKGEEDATPQLELYALWAHLALGYPLGAVSAHQVSLFKGAVSRIRMTEADKFYRLEKIRQSADLIQVLTGSGIDRGPSLSDFNYAPTVSICRRCTFQRVCREFP